MRREVRVNKLNNKNGRSPAKEIAAIAVEVALLIGGQAAIGPVMGVEIVTVLLLTFAWAYGPRAGVLAAICFSLLRCMIWGVDVHVVVLYLLYYPLFALTFGALGKISDKTYSRFPVWAAVLVNVVIAAVGAAACFFAATDFLKISRLYAVLVKTLLWIIFALACALFVTFNVLIILSRSGKVRGASAVKVTVAAALAAFFTILFTILDDFLGPAFYGYELFSESWAVYFYGSFLALAPQTVCAIVTVSLLFIPLTRICKIAVKRI